MNKAYDFDDIDDYLHGRMSESDKSAFEEALKADPELERRVEALRAESQVFRLLRDDALLEQFGKWETETTLLHGSESLQRVRC
jgi:anti-sigma factor RsiW